MFQDQEIPNRTRTPRPQPQRRRDPAHARKQAALSSVQEWHSIDRKDRMRPALDSSSAMSSYLRNGALLAAAGLR
ncbi:hypothetical protein Adu01nite_72480 [Paractinoplanes durhamensis]|uniref:Uncharacterized protein n=1 Tax=Paractinoplanes durhamensis TaxID=113563 RepID=A0ABQ3Z7T7_9ACTN|nr:hypothetical protein Adu01nite_72480 [Actinoplanes durhamensis]